MPDSLLSKDVTVFNTKISVANAGLALFTVTFILLSVIEISLSLHLTLSQRLWLYFFANFVCFNNTHVIITLLNIWMIPEYKKIVVDHLKVTAAKQAGIFLFFLGLFLIIYKHDLLMKLMPMGLPFIIGVIAFRLFHGIRQTMGIGFLINTQALHAKKMNRDEDARSRRLEHLGVKLMILGLLPLSATFYQSSLNLPNFVLKYATPFAGTLIAIAFGFLVRSIFLIPCKETRTQKIIFNLRYLEMGFIPFSAFAHTYSAALHGLEYMDIQRRGLAASQVAAKVKRSYLIANVVLFAVFVLIGYLIDWNYNGLENKPAVAQLAGIFALTVTYFHYVIDSIVYRMKDPTIRQEILPLLIAKPDAHQTEQIPLKKVN